MTEARRTVAITGFGVFSCFGRGPEPLQRAVFAAEPGFADVTRFDTAARQVRQAAHAPGSPALSDVFETAARDALRMAGHPEVPLAAGIALGTQGAWQGLTSFWRGETSQAD